MAILSILAAAVGALLGFSSTSLVAYLLPDAGMQSLLVYAVALLMASVGYRLAGELTNLVMRPRPLCKMSPGQFGQWMSVIYNFDKFKLGWERP